ncbi:phosphoribosylanthranilate transferase Trp4 [Schizosaccharomyces japonicus yFS275]|uniref:Anthranilate phosphoribosyltransferase n=1 Tax=Schizosaccharomyces japonicus (strain yFS275 / FY16936) TaxID=402676 RepID=B6K3I2_SCHJY|nr:phosphoribosylanthranilate transferase Trp4 [Schizosaccharomyces japonicus yFS275]EEB08039.1 phosphoribosylanthranilate transferase Trp4 [Schizosaccharomyces japonicus yFS275]
MSVINPEIKKAMKSIDSCGIETPVDVLVNALRCVLEGKTTEAESAAFLVALRLSRLEDRPQVLMEFIKLVKSYALSIEGMDQSSYKYVDIVGTGGDGQNTFNVSTTAAIVAAGAGLHVCKHGNKASTSSSGSADLLMSFGCALQNVTPKTLCKISDSTRFMFLFAPYCHPSMKYVANVRRLIGVPTVFNLMGPLLNPVPTFARIIGVSRPSLGMVFAEALQLLGADNSMVVCGAEGLDEISPAGLSYAWIVKDGVIRQEKLTPEQFGLPVHPLSSVASGTPDENAALLKQLLTNQLPESHPVLDYVLLNASALLTLAGVATDYVHGVEVARESIRSGKALQELTAFAETSQKFGQ